MMKVACRCLRQCESLAVHEVTQWTSSLQNSKAFLCLLPTVQLSRLIYWPLTLALIVDM